MEPDSRTSSKPGRRQRNHSSLPLLAPTSIHKKSKTGVGRTLPSAAFVVIRLHAAILRRNSEGSMHSARSTQPLPLLPALPAHDLDSAFRQR
jgi:hypothetical protein